jgi:hypothetical protein
MNQQARSRRVSMIVAVAIGLVWLALFVAGFIFTVVWLLSQSD